MRVSIFAGLPHELGLTPHRSRRLSIRVEVDTRPPAGAVLTSTIERRQRRTFSMTLSNLASPEPGPIPNGLDLLAARRDPSKSLYSTE